jgi:hypothetical protein
MEINSNNVLHKYSEDAYDIRINRKKNYLRN